MTRPSGKVQGRVLAWVAVGITVVGLVIGGVFVIRDGAKAKADRAELEASLATKCEAYSWPESDIAALLPQPKSTKGEIKSESSDYFSIEVCDTDAKQYADYVKSVQDNGFTVDYSKSADIFNAKNADGYSVSVSRDTDDETIMSITIQVPEKKEDTSTDGDAAKQDDKSTDTALIPAMPTSRATSLRIRRRSRTPMTVLTSSPRWTATRPLSMSMLPS